jgi:hypothetical protein
MKSANEQNAKGQTSIASFFNRNNPIKRRELAQLANATKDAPMAEAASCPEEVPMKGEKRAYHVGPSCSGQPVDKAVTLKRTRHAISIQEVEPEQKAKNTLEQQKGNHTEMASSGCTYAPGQTIQRNPSRHALARRKFAVQRDRMVLGNDASNTIAKGSKYTPLEQQVIELKKRNSDKILLVEVWALEPLEACTIRKECSELGCSVEPPLL